MALLAIELNDAGIRAARGSNDGLLAVDGADRCSPGFVWIRKKKPVVTGRAAAQQACFHPLDVHDRFWDQLDTEPVDPRDPRSPNRAEAVLAHLQHVVELIREPADDVVFAVPPFYDERQLGILVAIARDLKMPLRGLVATPIALDAGAGTVMVVELSLHRCTLSSVEAGPRVELGRTRVCPEVGLLAFRRQWTKTIGNEFVRKTRFDPLHDATTEHQLHDGLAALLDALVDRGSDQLAVQAGSRTHRVTITDQMLEHAGHALVFELCRDVQTELASGTVSAILLTHDAGRVPGLASALRRQVAPPVSILPPGAAARGLTTLWPDCFDLSAAPAIAYHESRGAGERPSPPPTEAERVTS
jgi:hypothetical protein